MTHLFLRYFLTSQFCVPDLRSFDQGHCLIISSIDPECIKKARKFVLWIDLDCSFAHKFCHKSGYIFIWCICTHCFHCNVIKKYK